MLPLRGRSLSTGRWWTRKSNCTNRHQQKLMKRSVRLDTQKHTKKNSCREQDNISLELVMVKCKTSIQIKFSGKGVTKTYLKRTQVVKRKVASEPVIYHHTNKQLKKSPEHQISLSVSLQSALCKRSAHLLTLS